MKEISLTIPLKPVAKGRPRHVIMNKYGDKPFVIVYTPKKTAEYEKKLAVYGESLRLTKIKKNVALYVEVCFEFKKPKTVTRKYPIIKPDLDNLVKSLLDGLKIRDEQVITIISTKIYGEEDAIHFCIKEIK